MGKNRHTCYVCNKKRYEEKMIPVQALNVFVYATTIETTWICKPVKLRYSELTLTKCRDKHLINLQSLADRFKKLSEIFDNSRISKLSDLNGQKTKHS